MEIENCIYKYLLNEATTDELDYLSKWILEEKNEKKFREYVKIHLETTTAMNKPDTDQIKKNLLSKIKRDRNRKVFMSVMKYAAMIVIVIAVSLVYKQQVSSPLPSNILIPKEEPITIRLENGTIKEIVPTEKTKLLNANGTPIGTQDHTRIIYENNDQATELVYNTLEVPFGKTFDVILSDGTHVYLNAGTSFKYPVAFIKNENRVVYITGEAYFDVAKDSDHVFVVNANGVDIEVLGTKFNVANYTDASSINTVLVEGSIALHRTTGRVEETNSPLLLEPGDKAEWNRQSNQVDVEQVETSIYTSWIHGKLIFRNTPFREIRKTLERKYNVIIKNNNIDLDAQPYDATFDIESIEEILESFNRSYSIDYTIKNNEVIIQ